MKKYFLDKRTLVSGKKNYLNTSNFLSLKTYIDNLISTSIDATNKINENEEELYESEIKIKDSDNEYLRL